MLRFTRFTPTRRFWHIGWARFNGRICGVSVASRRRALLIDWLGR